MRPNPYIIDGERRTGLFQLILYFPKDLGTFFAGIKDSHCRLSQKQIQLLLILQERLPTSILFQRWPARQVPEFIRTGMPRNSWYPIRYFSSPIRRINLGEISSILLKLYKILFGPSAKKICELFTSGSLALVIKAQCTAQHFLNCLVHAQPFPLGKAPDCPVQMLIKAMYGD